MSVTSTPALTMVHVTTQSLDTPATVTSGTQDNIVKADFVSFFKNLEKTFSGRMLPTSMSLKKGPSTSLMELKSCATG